MQTFHRHNKPSPPLNMKIMGGFLSSKLIAKKAIILSLFVISTSSTFA
jgi:hypothetical protein